MFVVALTGGIGCGKSEATKTLSELGVPVVDVDVISHQLTSAGQPILKTIADAFGTAYLDQAGALDRAKMRKLVFSDDDARIKLNSILHPAIYEEALKQLSANAAAPYQVLAIPLLFESPRYRTHVDKTLVIDCDENTQIQRVIQRSNLTVSEVQKILDAQTSRETRLASADFVINNDGNLNDLRKNIIEFHKKVINTCILSKTIS